MRINSSHTKIKLDGKYTAETRMIPDGKFVSVDEQWCKNSPLDIILQKWTIKVDIMMETHIKFHSISIFHWATNNWHWRLIDSWVTWHLSNFTNHILLNGNTWMWKMTGKWKEAVMTYSSLLTVFSYKDREITRHLLEQLISEVKIGSKNLQEY